MLLTPNPSDDDLCRLLDACGLRLPPACGTVAAYMRHLHRKEQPCRPCTDVYEEARKVWLAKPRRPRPIKHGTPAGARAHQSRREPACGDCARAYRTYQNEYRAARKARQAA